MTHFDRASVAAAPAVLPDGWRKVTVGVIEADRKAEDGVRLNHDRTRCVVAVKRVGAHIGLKPADLVLLDTLVAFTQPQDWEAGRRPIVWASNAYLTEITGFSLSTVKRHARRLAELGVLAFRDSPNGKRWGRRDAEGVIVEAYGFDLSPLSARVEEFEAQARALAEERAHCQRLRRQITVARRSIRARLEAPPRAGQGAKLALARTAFEGLLQSLPGPRAASAFLRGLLQQFLDLLDGLDRTFAAADIDEPECQNKKELNPREPKSDPHIPITNQLHSVTCSCSEKGANDDMPGASDATGLERNDPIGIDLGVILQSCPEFTSWGRNLGRDIRNWRDFIRVARDLRPMVGVSEDAWVSAQTQMGQPVAAAALALVFEKAHSGEVTSPGGYLRGMAAKARTGELHLARSFFGRLNTRAA